jgi:type IV pilus assembly protein PilB
MSKFTEILLSKNIISQNELFDAQKEAAEKNESLSTILTTRGVDENAVLEAKSEAFGIPYKKIAGKIPFEILKYIPEDTAKLYKIAPLDIRDGVLEVGMIDPQNIEAKEALQFIISKFEIPFKIFLISDSDFKKILKEYKGLGSEVTKTLSELETALTDELTDKLKKGEKKEKISVLEGRFVEEAPITKMVAVILKHAIEGRASDVHIEPVRDNLRVRFRVDGILHTSLSLPKTVHEAIVSRIKILSNMQLDEKRKPQDGRFNARIKDRDVDFRVSTFPTYFGEKVSIRILDPQKNIRTFSQIGLQGRNLKELEAALKRPYGLILITGPTGSGKSTTLYAMLQDLNKDHVNIVSLEDPIEYNIEGVNQSQVKPEINYDFASGLRSILRQDPDIIMVGEIRDKETASLAIHAALTGHLVLSTLHTNTAIGVIPRLIDMGIDPFLIAPTLILAISQRLTRTLCPQSRRAVPLKGMVKENIEKEINNLPPQIKKDIKIPKEIFQALPSPACPQGTRGRIGVFEVLVMTKELEEVILSNPSSNAVAKQARAQGMITMREDGLLKVLDGVIGLEELSEVTVSDL